MPHQHRELRQYPTPSCGVTSSRGRHYAGVSSMQQDDVCLSRTGRLVAFGDRSRFLAQCFFRGWLKNTQDGSWHFYALWRGELVYFPLIADRCPPPQYLQRFVLTDGSTGTPTADSLFFWTLDRVILPGCTSAFGTLPGVDPATLLPCAAGPLVGDDWRIVSPAVTSASTPAWTVSRALGSDGRAVGGVAAKVTWSAVNPEDRAQWVRAIREVVMWIKGGRPRRPASGVEVASSAVPSEVLQQWTTSGQQVLEDTEMGDVYPNRWADYVLIAAIDPSKPALRESLAESSVSCTADPTVLESVWMSTVVHRAPAIDHQDLPLPASISAFCFPLGVRLRLLHSDADVPAPSFHSFVVTLLGGTHLFGHCVCTWAPMAPTLRQALWETLCDSLVGKGPGTLYAPVAIALLTRLPAHELIRRLLVTVVAATTTTDAAASLGGLPSSLCSRLSSPSSCGGGGLAASTPEHSPDSEPASPLRSTRAPALASKPAYATAGSLPLLRAQTSIVPSSAPGVICIQQLARPPSVRLGLAGFQPLKAKTRAPPPPPPRPLASRSLDARCADDLWMALDAASAASMPPIRPGPARIDVAGQAFVSFFSSPRALPFLDVDWSILFTSLPPAAVVDVW